MSKPVKKINPTRELIHEVIFEADTPFGKLFDILLLIFILGSVIVVMLESMERINQKARDLFVILEWIFTIFFTIEYILRLYGTYKPIKYATSAFGIIDLLSILPTYLSLIITGTQSLMVIRALRLLRVFRVFKLGSYMRHGQMIMLSLQRSIPKITVFFLFVLVLVTIIGSLMYLIESEGNSGFKDIPTAIYWAIVTLTTVGYGDITPQTGIGKMFSAVVMMLGYCIIAIPTGIIAVDLFSEKNKQDISTQVCRYCADGDHSFEAIYCKSCGEILKDPEYKNGKIAK